MYLDFCYLFNLPSSYPYKAILSRCVSTTKHTFFGLVLLSRCLISGRFLSVTCICCRNSQPARQLYMVEVHQVINFNCSFPTKEVKWWFSSQCFPISFRDTAKYFSIARAEVLQTLLVLANVARTAATTPWRKPIHGLTSMRCFH